MKQMFQQKGRRFKRLRDFDEYKFIRTVFDNLAKNCSTMTTRYNFSAATILKSTDVNDHLYKTVQNLRNFSKYFKDLPLSVNVILKSIHDVVIIDMTTDVLSQRSNAAKSEHDRIESIKRTKTSETFLFKLRLLPN